MFDDADGVETAGIVGVLYSDSPCGKRRRLSIVESRGKLEVPDDGETEE